MTKTSDRDDMLERILAFVRARDWEQFHSPKDTAMAISLEASEVMEHFLWKKPAEIKEYVHKNKAKIGEELVDVLYWVLLMAHYLEIDLNDSFEKKMAQNEKKYPIEKAKGSHRKYTHYQSRDKNEKPGTLN